MTLNTIINGNTYPFHYFFFHWVGGKVGIWNTGYPGFKQLGKEFAWTYNDYDVWGLKG